MTVTDSNRQNQRHADLTLIKPEPSRKTPCRLSWHIPNLDNDIRMQCQNKQHACSLKAAITRPDTSLSTGKLCYIISNLIL